MKKIKVKILNCKIDRYNDGLNKSTKYILDIKLKYKNKEYILKDYQTIKCVNDSTYSDEYLIVYGILDLLDKVRTYKEFNKFKTCIDMLDFKDYYGFDDIENTCRIINDIKYINNVVYKALKDVVISLGDELLDVLSDGSPELVMKYKPLVDKYFKIKKGECNA